MMDIRDQIKPLFAYAPSNMADDEFSNLADRINNWQDDIEKTFKTRPTYNAGEFPGNRRKEFLRALGL